MVAWAVTAFGVSVGAFWMASRFLLIGRVRGVVGIFVGTAEAMLGTAIIIGLLSANDVTMFLRPLVLITQVGIAGLIGWEGRLAREALVDAAAHETVKRMREFGEGIRPGEIDDDSA